MALLIAGQLSAATLQVGPGQPYRAPCAAIAAAAPGDTIEIDAAGNYSGDVCAWTKDNLTLRGIGGRAKIDAAGRNVQGKGIWVIAGRNTTVENIEFSGASVTDHNGAAIRQEGANLIVRNCYFHDNEEGILAGDAAGSDILIEYSEFANNGYGDGFSHNMYINHVARLTLRFCYSHHAREGHLVKSRAAENYILYNRLSDEETGTASYELDLPNGGKSYVIGNLIEQGPSTANSTILRYREEGPNPANPDTRFFAINNTFVNDRKNGGIFISIDPSDPTPAVIENNIFYGPGTINTQASAILTSNITTGDPRFVNPAQYDYRLQPGSPAIDAGADLGTGDGFPLAAMFEYVHPACGEGRVSAGAIDIGAYEFGGSTAYMDGPARCRLISPGGIVNAASFLPGPVAPGSIIAVLGANLASATAQANTMPLPFILGGTSVTVNGILAPLFAVSPTRIDAQLPFEIAPGAAAAMVNAGGTLTAPASFTVNPAAPAIFLAGGNRALAQNQDSSLNSSANPASAGSVVTVYLTGQGLLDGAIDTGAPAPPAPLLHPLLPWSATIGGIDTEILFIGLTPGFVGLLQAGVRVPALAGGDYPLAIAIGGSDANAALIAIGIKSP